MIGGGWRDPKQEEKRRLEDERQRRIDELLKEREGVISINQPTGPFGAQWTPTGVPTDASGRPLAPQFGTVGEESTGLLKEQYNLRNLLNTQALEQIRQEGLRQPGVMSKWGQMALSQAQNQAARQVQGQLAQAQGQLAMQGGLRTGARERLAAQGMQSQLQVGQRALGDVQMQDEATRQRWLGMIPQMELATAGYGTDIQNRNIQRALDEVTQRRLLQQRQYDEAMRAWAAERTAQATPSGGGKK